MTQPFLIHPNDELMLKNMLAVESLPMILVEEVDLQTKMFHRACGSGPLGAMGLISIIRQLGMKPPRSQAATGPTEWRKYKKGTRIEAYYFGNWMPGIYDRPSSNGMLCIRLDENPEYVKEARAGIVRLAKGAAELSAADFPAKDEGPDARITLLDRKPAVQPAEDLKIKNLGAPKNDGVYSATDPEYAMKEAPALEAPVVLELVKREGVTPEQAILAAMAETTEQKPVPTPTVTTPILAKGRIDNLPIRKRPTRDNTPDAEPETIDLASDDGVTNWGNVQAGAKVFFETDGDYIDAEFAGKISGEDEVIYGGEQGPFYWVKIGDEKKMARPQELTLVG